MDLLFGGCAVAHAISASKDTLCRFQWTVKVTLTSASSITPSRDPRPPEQAREETHRRLESRIAEQSRNGVLGVGRVGALQDLAELGLDLVRGRALHALALAPGGQHQRLARVGVVVSGEDQGGAGLQA